MLKDLWNVVGDYCACADSFFDVAGHIQLFTNGKHFSTLSDRQRCWLRTLSVLLSQNIADREVIKWLIERHALAPPLWGLEDTNFCDAFYFHDYDIAGASPQIRHKILLTVRYRGIEYDMETERKGWNEQYVDQTEYLNDEKHENGGINTSIFREFIRTPGTISLNLRAICVNPLDPHQQLREMRPWVRLNSWLDNVSPQMIYPLPQDPVLRMVHIIEFEKINAIGNGPKIFSLATVIYAQIVAFLLAPYVAKTGSSAPNGPYIEIST